MVLGLCKHGLFLTRTFARRGVPVIALEADPRRASARTRYGRKVWCGGLEDETLIATLQGLKGELARPAPLFPTNDRMVDVLLAHWDRLEDAYLLPFGGIERFADLKDKARLHELARDFGFEVPQSHFVDSVEEIRALASAMSFPVAVKPAWPMGSFKIHRCADLADILRRAGGNGRLAEPLVIQEWLPGAEESLVFGAYYIARDGSCAARYGGRKILAFPGVAGHAVACRSAEIPDLVERGYAFLRSAGYWGLGSIEYKMVGPDRPVFIEVTVGRTDWWVMACAVNGVNLPLAAYTDLTGAAIPHANAQRDRVVWHDLEGTLYVIPRKLRTGEWSFGRLLSHVAARKKEALFDWRDPRPFLTFAGRFLRGRLRRMRRADRRVQASAPEGP